MLIFKAETEKISRKNFNGVEHLIVPVIALIEGVITSGNSDGVPQLALAEEFGNHPSGWDGRPVLVDHPTINGELVSANIPEVLESEEIGKLFNTRLEDKKLKTEAWINLEIVKEKGGIIASTIKRLEDGEMVEISTGLFADTKNESGMHNNEKFEGVWENVVPDHLAILSEAKGACSIEDGCGAPRLNSTNEDEKMKINEDCECKTSPCSCEAIKENKEKEEGKNVSFFTILSKLNIFKKQSKMSDTDIRHALNAAIKEKNPNAFVFLESVFKDSFVFQDAMNGDFFSQSFKIESDGSITLGEDVEQVRPELDFVPVKINVENEDNQMDKEKFVTDLIANESTAFNSDDKDWLIELDENRLEKLMPPVVNAKHDPEEDEEKKKEKKNEEEEKPSVNSSPETAEEYIKAAPAEMRDVLSNGLQLHNKLRADMITGVIANKSNQFSEEELKNFDIAMLKKLSTLAVVVDYSGQGSFRDHTSDNDTSAPEVPKVFQNANEIKEN